MISPSNIKPKPIELASQGKLTMISWASLTKTDIQDFDKNGLTLLHHAAKLGVWDQVPEELKDKTLWQEAKDGTTIYMAAYEGRSQSWIAKNTLSKEDLLKENQNGISVISLAIKKGLLETIPQRLLTKKVLTSPRQNGDLVIHLIARHGQFDLISKDLLTEDMLSLTGEFGDSVYHILASEEKLSILPEKLITKRALLLKTSSGLTPLHNIAGLTPHLIPKEISIKEMLVKKNNGETPLHYWARLSQDDTWLNIPDKFLNDQSLMVKSKENTSPLSYIMGHFKKTKNYERGKKPEMTRKIKLIFSKLSKNSLKQCLKRANNDLAILINKEIQKRKVMESLHKKEHTIDI